MENFKHFKGKTKDYFNRNHKKIKIFAKIGIHFLVIGGTVILFQKKANEIKDLKKILIKTNVELLKSKDLHREKDEYMCRLASRLLRQGISEGGQLMASRKEYLRKI